MRHSKEFVELTTRCDYNLENFGVVPVYLDKDLSEVLQIWSKNIT